MNGQSKYWVFTVNNYSLEDEKHLQSLVDDQKASYLVYGREVGESGTPHLQGYVEFTQRKRLSRVRNLVSDRGHFEMRRGTAAQAREYCIKDGVVQEFGTISAPAQGKRNDLEEIRLRIKDGAREVEIADEYFSRWVVYRRSFAAYRDLLQPALHRPDLRVICLWGPAGTGKTRIVFNTFESVFSVPDSSLRWFDGYRQEPVVLIDDFRSDVIGLSGSWLLRLLDIYPLQVPVKGSFVSWNPKCIVITSNEEPPWSFVREEEPLMRRLHKIVYFEDLDFEDDRAVEERANEIFVEGL